MKRFLSISAFIGIAFCTTFSSCKKCMHCTSTAKSNGAVVYSYPETCGKKKSLTSQELTYRFSLPDTLDLKCPRD